MPMKFALQKVVTILFLFLVLYSCSGEVQPPKPYGAIPTEDQVKWQQMEYYMFVHFGPNTFTNVEWGDGKEDPRLFNPADVDCRQWASVAKAAGMRGIIITAKHHDGFCLWPSKYSAHTVRESPWKDGKGDLLKELSEACREYGLKFGVYLSPWDQNHPAYGTAEYNQIFANTLDEVLSGYGDVFEQWFDGANGEGEDGKKQKYDWPLYHSVVYKNQPHAIIFSDVGPGCRWMGNERGVAGETNWSTLNTEGYGPGLDAPSVEVLNRGDEGGKNWVPAETDVSIRPGWFYSPDTDDKVKSVEKLMDIYYTSVGRNANLLLNVPPDRRGRIHPNDSVRLMEFRKALDEAFANDLIQGAEIKADNVRGNSSRFLASNVLDDDYNTYWTTDDARISPVMEIDLKENKIFNRLLLQEYIPLGQRVASFSVKYWDNVQNDWSDLAEGTTIGYKRILRFPSVETSKLKIEFNALACPVISTISLFASREYLSSPVIGRGKSGMVSIVCDSPDPVIYYTTDSSAPDISSKIYQTSFSLPEGGIVRAVTMINNGMEKSEVVAASFDISPAKWSVVSPQGGDAAKAIDGNNSSFAKIAIEQEFVIDLGELCRLKGFSYMPVANGEASNISRYDLYVSPDGKEWAKVRGNANFDTIKNTPVQQHVFFDKAFDGRFLKLKALELTNKNSEYTVAEIGIITR